MIMTKEELAKNYDSKTSDKKWFDFWVKNNYFHAEAQSKKPPYCIVIPPPNVTGVLHMGHALVNTLQDILIRWKRMSGFEALWVPGTDHAGISTQTVVERHLMKTTGKKRTEFAREEFLNHVWEWKEKNEELIVGQLKRLGCSCDWKRQRFTMDEGNNQAVRSAFKKFFDAGLIYRGDYLVNWDPVTQTAIADDEVEYEERQGFLWHFKYALEDKSGYAIVATTRPETMLGDTAIAVSTKDPRYTSLIGKNVIHPFQNRTFPIIADHRIDPEFGTGMVKITPAHDPLDYQLGTDHNLPFINIMTPDGKINENGGAFAGMPMEEARKAVVEELKKLGLLEKIVPHTNRVGLSYRSKAAVEPYISKQWFVKMSTFAPKLEAAVKNSQVKIIPDNWESTYFHWIKNLRDWCISRQLWWGHRIPIWYNKENPEKIICYDGEGLPPEVKKEPTAWEQDPDVLDTWFSSALWPFATLGWPENTPELKKFYPNAVLVTGHDILFFWVARMILMGEYIMEKPPFPEVFLHGLIYGKSYWKNIPGGGVNYITGKERHDYEMGKPVPSDVHSRYEKMSKTKGNITDPLEIIDAYGTDAMRMALTASATQAREIDLDLRKFEEYKNFANKVWNGARFVFMNIDGNSEQGLSALSAEDLSQGWKESDLKLEDRWILSKLNHTIDDVNKSLSNYAFDQAAQEAYNFFWKEFCAYYVEIVKPTLFGKVGTAEERTLKQKILTVILLNAIRLLHPMAPFITEELFTLIKERFPNLQYVKGSDPYTSEALQALAAPACIVAPYPKVIRKEDINPTIEEAFDLVDKVVYMIRNIRGEMKIPTSSAVDVYLVGSEGDATFKMIQDNATIISSLVRIGKLTITTQEPSLAFTSSGVVNTLKILIPLPTDLLDKEKVRLEKEKEKLQIQVDRLAIQLGNPEFTNKAPEKLITSLREQQENQQNELLHIEKKLAMLGTNK